VTTDGQLEPNGTLRERIITEGKRSTETTAMVFSHEGGNGALYVHGEPENSLSFEVQDDEELALTYLDRERVTELRDALSAWLRASDLRRDDG
jgi:hypothetical protein